MKLFVATLFAFLCLEANAVQSVQGNIGNIDRLSDGAIRVTVVPRGVDVSGSVPFCARNGGYTYVVPPGDTSTATIVSNAFDSGNRVKIVGSDTCYSTDTGWYATISNISVSKTSFYYPLNATIVDGYVDSLSVRSDGGIRYHIQPLGIFGNPPPSCAFSPTNFIIEPWEGKKDFAATLLHAYKANIKIEVTAEQSCGVLEVSTQRVLDVSNAP